MKNVTKTLLTGLLALGLTACGMNAQPPMNQYGVYGQNGFNNFNGQYNPMMGGNNCINQASQNLNLSFTAQGARFNGTAGFYAGTLPQTHPMRGQYGTVAVGGNSGLQQVPGSAMVTKQSPNGNINLSINPQSGSVSGMIQISAQALYSTGVMNFLYAGGQTNWMPGGYQQAPVQNNLCVTSLALDVIYTSSYGYYGQMSSGTVNSALIYLYLSNGQMVPVPVQL